MMKRLSKLLLIAVLLATVLSVFVPQVAMAQEIVRSGVNYMFPEYHRMSFYDSYSDRIYVFSMTSDGATLVMQSSDDLGETWSSTTTIRETVQSTGGYAIAYWDSGTQGYFDYGLTATGGAKCYRRARIEADGSITWLAVEQSPGWTGVFRDIAIDSNGKAWIIDDANKAYRNANTDGTWSTERTDTLIWTDGRIATELVALTSGKMAVIGTKTNYQIGAKAFTGSGWSAEVEHSVSIFQVGRVCATPQDDDVHIVYFDSNYDVNYTKYRSSTNDFTGNAELYAGTQNYAYPVISRCADNNDLFVWHAEDPTASHLYFHMYVASEGTWYTQFDWLTDSSGIKDGGGLQTMEYVDRDHAGLFWIDNAPNLKWKLLDAQFDVDTLTPTGVTETQATARGEIVSIGWGTPYERGIYLDTTPSLGNATGTLQLWYETGSFGVGVFSHTFGNLTEGQDYFYIAYASNVETAWGEWVEFIAGSTEGWCVVTLDPDPVGDFEATFWGNITNVAGDYATVRGFEWGHTATATWSWTDTGQFTVGAYSHEVELEADSIYYVRAVAGNSTVTDYGQWIGFMTHQPSYIDEDIDDSQILPPAPEEPGGWIKPPRDWGTALGIPWTFILFLFLSSIVVVVGIALSAVQARTISVLFIVFGLILGWFCFWPRGGYLDWWIMLPYVLVGWALMNREKENPLA